MSPPPASLQEIFSRLIQTLALSRRPSTIMGYRVTVRRFLSYLRTGFPEVQQLSQLRRDPHLLGWFRSLADEQPPLTPKTRSTRILILRCLLEALEADGHPLLPRLIRREDFPKLPIYLPRALSSSDDQRLLDELRRQDDWISHALLLLRLTGMRIGECIDLTIRCLREIAPGAWALHVPIGKLHTDRMVPADDDIRHTVARLLSLHAVEPPSAAPSSPSEWLLPRSSRSWLYETLRRELAAAGQRAGCSVAVTPHMLRHTFASEMVRLGISLPALMQLLGHTNIRMTMRYVQVTHVDLQREFHAARSNADTRYHMPTLPVPAVQVAAGLPAILQALGASRHLLEAYRRQLNDSSLRRKAHLLNRRLFAVTKDIERLGEAEK